MFPSRPACACTSHSSPRRRFAGRLLAGAFALSTGALARADDGLLDPDKIGASRKSAEKNGLLGALPESSMRSAADPRADDRSSGYAGSGMTPSVVAAIDSLTLSLSDLVKKLHQLDAEAARLGSDLSTLRYDMDSKLEEYRQGLFCSGCGKTKSEILAKGETFPHAGQTVIKATPAQIASKQSELQAPIDRAEGELDRNRRTRKKSMDDRNEAISQIDPGLSLWCTGFSADVDQLAAAEIRSAAGWASQRKQAEAQRARLRALLARAGTPDTASIKAELATWDDIEKQLDAQRAQAHQHSQDALAQAARGAALQRNRLAEFLARDGVRDVVSATVTVRTNLPTSSPDTLGLRFRMGRYDAAGHDEILSSVQSFVIQFRRSGGGRCAVPFGAVINCGIGLSTNAPDAAGGALLD
jgi:predicted Fe-S protein YdhL (DUF1289 family)